MSEKPESDEFEEEDAEDAAPGGDDVERQWARATRVTFSVKSRPASTVMSRLFRPRPGK